MAIAARGEQAHQTGRADAAAAALALTLRGGARVDRYDVLDVLGVGAFGAVYRARHVHTRQIVALKVLRTEARARPGAWEGLLKEARAAASLGHPNIVRVMDCGVSEQGAPFLVMELVEGADLGRLLRHENRAFSVPRALEIAQQMLAGLSAAHARGIVHRDIKPANVFVTPMLGPGGTTREHVRLLDFGISKVLDADPELQRTLPGMALGTPGYMAPEQFGDARAADARADVYAVAATLYELFTGRTPFGSVEFEVLLAKVRFERPPPLAQLAPHVPLRVAEVIDRGLARDPDARWSSAAQFAAALRDALAEVTAVGVTGHDESGGGAFGGAASQRTSALALGTAPTTALPSVAAAGSFVTGPGSGGGGAASAGTMNLAALHAPASGAYAASPPRIHGASAGTPPTRESDPPSHSRYVGARATPPPVAGPHGGSFAPHAYASAPPSSSQQQPAQYTPAPASAHGAPRTASALAAAPRTLTAPPAAAAPTRVLPLVLAVAGGSLLTLLVVGAFLLGQYHAQTPAAAGASVAQQAGGGPPMLGGVPQQGVGAMPMQPGYPPAPMAAPYAGSPAPAPQPSAPVAVAAPQPDPDEQDPAPAADHNEAAGGEPLYAMARADGVALSELQVVGQVSTAAVRSVAQRAVRSMGECRVAGRRLTVRVQIFVNMDGSIPIAHPWNGAAGDSGPTPVAQCVADHFREAAPHPWTGAGNGIFGFRADLAPAR